MKKYHIFDLDGTIADSMPYWGRICSKMLDDNHIDYPSDLMRIITPMNIHEKATYFSSIGFIVKDDASLQRKIDELMLSYYQSEIGLKSGVKGYLHKLKDDGNSLYILSATKSDTVKTFLAHNGILSLFSEIFSAADYDLSKSDSRIYRLAKEKIGCAFQDITYYDDNLVATTVAKSLGMYTVGVYDELSDDGNGTLKKTSDRYILSFNELL